MKKAGLDSDVLPSAFGATSTTLPISMSSNAHTPPTLRQSADPAFLGSLPIWSYGGEIIFLRQPESAQKAVEELLL
ncbi:MAG: hypothetical protein LBB14_01180, partial [Puniceicoccales bacterium]|nr:hypothetical protein [Puniceicoccales bacterium]